MCCLLVMVFYTETCSPGGGVANHNSVNLVTVMDHPRTGVLALTLRQNKHLRSEAQQQPADDGAAMRKNCFCRDAPIVVRAVRKHVVTDVLMRGVAPRPFVQRQ